MRVAWARRGKRQEAPDRSRSASSPSSHTISGALASSTTRTISSPAALPDPFETTPFSEHNHCLRDRRIPRGPLPRRRPRCPRSVRYTSSAPQSLLHSASGIGRQHAHAPPARSGCGRKGARARRDTEIDTRGHHGKHHLLCLSNPRRSRRITEQKLHVGLRHPVAPLRVRLFRLWTPGVAVSAPRLSCRRLELP